MLRIDRLWLRLGLTVGALASPGLAHAQGLDPIRLEYSAPEGCPGREVFWSEVRARTPRAVPAHEGEPARGFRVVLAWTEAGAQGTLTLTERNGATSSRVVDGDTCPAVASALALVTVLAIDPSASTALLSVDAAGTAAPLSVPLAPTPTPPAPRGTLTDESRQAVTPPRGRKKEDDGARDFGSDGLRLEGAASIALDVLGVGGGAGTVFGPSFLLGLAIVRPGLLAPELRAGLSYASSEAIADPGGEGSATFAWWRGELDACPLRLALARTLRASPCAIGRAGAIVSAGHGTSTSNRATTPWGEVGLSALVEWEVVGPMRLEAEAGFGFPLTRRTFEFTAPHPDAVYTPTVVIVMPEARIGAGVHFP